MGSLPENSNRRGALRCPLPQSRQEAVLKVGEDHVMVRLVDESAEGFAVLAERTPGVEVDDVIQLWTTAGRFEVRVASIAQEGASRTYLPQVRSQVRSPSRLGLERLRDLGIQEDRPSRMAWFDRLWQTGSAPWSSSSTTSATMLIMACVVVPVLLIIAIVQFDRPLMKWLADWSKGSDFSLRPGSRQQAPRSRRQAANPQSTIHNSQSSLYSTIRRLPGPSALTVPEVVRELALTDTQRAEIRRILNATDEAIGQIDEYWGQDSRQALSQKRTMLLAEARRRALGVLTPQQRARWNALQDSGQQAEARD